MIQTFRLSTYLFDGTYIGTKQLEHSKHRYWPESMIYDQGKLYFLFDLTIDSADYPQYEWGTLDTCSSQISLRVATDKVWGRTNSPSFPDSYNNQLLYWNFYNDSIYRLKGDRYEVEYLWAKGDWRFTYEDGAKIYSPLRKGCLRIILWPRPIIIYILYSIYKEETLFVSMIRNSKRMACSPDYR